MRESRAVLGGFQVRQDHHLLVQALVAVHRHDVYRGLVQGIADAAPVEFVVQVGKPRICAAAQRNDKDVLGADSFFLETPDFLVQQFDLVFGIFIHPDIDGAACRGLVVAGDSDVGRVVDPVQNFLGAAVPAFQYHDGHGAYCLVPENVAVLEDGLIAVVEKADDSFFGVFQ